MRKRRVEFWLSVIASVAATALSWPFWRDFNYWAVTKQMWLVYFIVGFLLSIYVFYVFLGALHTLFEHDAIEHAEAAAKTAKTSQEGQP